MATDSGVRSVSNTLSGTTADAVTLTQAWPSIDVTNLDVTDVIYFRQDGITAVAGADGCTVLLPGQSKVAAGSVNSSGQHVISIVGDGGAYTIEGVN